MSMYFTTIDRNCVEYSLGSGIAVRHPRSVLLEALDTPPIRKTRLWWVSVTYKSGYWFSYLRPTQIAKGWPSASADCVRESNVNVLTLAVFSVCIVSSVSAWLSAESSPAARQSSLLFPETKLSMSMIRMQWLEESQTKRRLFQTERCDGSGNCAAFPSFFPEWSSEPSTVTGLDGQWVSVVHHYLMTLHVSLEYHSIEFVYRYSSGVLYGSWSILSSKAVYFWSDGNNLE